MEREDEQDTIFDEGTAMWKRLYHKLAALPQD